MLEISQLKINTMKRIQRHFIVFLFGISFLQIGFSQTSPELWMSGGVDVKMTEKWGIATALDIRFYDFGAPGTIFPEFSSSYQLHDNFKLSADYRLIFDENKFGNYTLENRLNLNGQLKLKFTNFNFTSRLRYQTKFGSIRSIANYSPEFDQALRIKPGIDFKLKNKKIKPGLDAEWFYSLENGELGKRFTKYRLSAGAEINLPGKNTLNVKYIFGQLINLPRQNTEHILSLAYTWEYDRTKAKKNKK